MTSDQLYARLTELGYENLRLVDGHGWCGTFPYFTTKGLCTGLDATGLRCRWCYQDHGEADRALANWDGKGHPPGNWIKVKGRFNGEVVDDFNPNFVK